MLRRGFPSSKTRLFVSTFSSGNQNLQMNKIRNYSSPVKDSASPGPKNILLALAALVGLSVVSTHDRIQQVEEDAKENRQRSYDLFHARQKNLKHAAGPFEKLVGKKEAVPAALSMQSEKDTAALKEQIKEKLRNELKDAQEKATVYAEHIKRLEQDLTKRARIGAEKERVEEELEKVMQQVEKAKLHGKLEAGKEYTKERMHLLHQIRKLKMQVESIDSTGSFNQCLLLQKIAMGTSDFESAMIRGRRSLVKEVNFFLNECGDDPLVDAAISTLSDDLIKNGCWSSMELYTSFVEAKESIRKQILIPATGGGSISELIARGVCVMKIKEKCESDLDVIERLIKDGDVVMAAKELDEIVKGTKAERLVKEWIVEANKRGVVEQVRDVLRALAATLSIS